MRGKHAKPRPYRSAGKQFVRGAAYDRGMHKMFGNEPLQAVKRDTGRNATLVPSEDASPRGEPVNTQPQLWHFSDTQGGCLFMGVGRSG